ncbi:hypothetical protein IAR50_007136 [Cryptococcus sp. DSM 104548]
MPPSFPPPDPSSSKRPVSASAFNFSLGSKSTKRPRTAVTPGSFKPPDVSNPAREAVRGEQGASGRTTTVSARLELRSDGNEGSERMVSTGSPASVHPARLELVQDGQTTPLNPRSAGSPGPMRQPPRFSSPSISRGYKPALASSSLVPLGLRAPPIVQQHDTKPNTRGKDFAPVTAPFEQVIKRDPLEDEKKTPLVTLAATKLSDKATEEMMGRKKAVVAEEDEGVGVSPRGKRVANWPNARAMPPSVQLANLLSSAKASQTLFYTSLQNTLFPTYRSADRKRQHDSAQPSPPTARQHIHQSADIVLSPVEAVGQVHDTLLFWCDVHAKSSTTLEHEERERVLVVLQPRAVDGPRLGVDPQVMRMRMLEGNGKKWVVGVWAANTIDMPIPMGGIVSPGKTLMVTRYLIAEQENA